MNNCFSKSPTSWSKKLSRQNIVRLLKVEFHPFLLTKHYKYVGRYSLPVG